jgi:hypothetical protein
MDLSKINIDSFSIDEILSLFDLTKPVTRSEINFVIDGKLKSYKSEKNINFLENARKKLIDFLNENNIESIFGETNIMIDDKQLIQKEISEDNEILTIDKINSFKKKNHNFTIPIHTRHRSLYVTLKSKDIARHSTFGEDERAFFNEFIEGQSRENLERILTNVQIFNEHKIINESLLFTIKSFDLKKCLKEYDHDLKRCIRNKTNENYTSEYDLVLDENGTPLKKNCGNTNNRFIKNKRVEQNILFDEITHTGPDSTQQYKENASNFLYDFNSKYNNIIKTTLLDICIRKNIINLFTPSKHYYMIVRFIQDGQPDVDIKIGVCTSIGKDSLKDVLSQINEQLIKTEFFTKDIFIIQNEETKEFKIDINENFIQNVTNIIFLNNETCNYELSLAFKLNILNKQWTHNTDTTQINDTTRTIRFPEYLYFVYDDLTNHYHSSYKASTRESTLTSSILAKIPLIGDKYILDNSGSNLDTFSRDYFGKINIDRARFKLLSPDGDLVNIDQTDYIENNYYFTLFCESSI